MSFTITIKDNENGEMLINEENAVAIIGSIGDKNGTHSILFSKCTGPEFYDCLCTARVAMVNAIGAIGAKMEMSKRAKDARTEEHEGTKIHILEED